MAHNVFISYSHIDKSTADAVCSILEKNDIRCWIAPRDIIPGTPFAEAIIDGIKGSKVFVLIYSKNSNHSPQVIKEVDRAVHHGLAIIPLRLEDVPMSKQLEYYVSDVHWLDAFTPPLELHINKLCNVIKMLLEMGDVDNNGVKIAFESENIEQEEPARKGRRYKHFRILIPAATALLVVVILGAVWFFKRQSNLHWAKEVALPEIERMIGENDAWRNLVKPYRLAEKAEAILKNDPELAKLFPKISLNIDILTQPPGAGVYMKEYTDTTGDWTYIGISPLDKIRVPIGIFRWKLVKEGYDTVLAAASTWGPGITPSTLIRTLDQVGTNQQGMVRVPATKTNIGSFGEFFIGKYEVTNREYKAFLDAGGYRNRDYWNYLFTKNGKEIIWNEAMKEFVDQSGQPGPATWIGGDYPMGEGSYPVSGVSWYEAAAYAEYAGMSLPTSIHWNIARGALTPMNQSPQLGGFAVLAPFTNFGRRGPVAVGSLQGITAYGAYDMAGNVREWCWNDTFSGKVIRGGSWEDNTYEFAKIRQAPALDRSSRNGIRLALYPNSDSIPSEAFSRINLTFSNNTRIQKPVPDNIFQVYTEQFAYDSTELNARVEYHEESAGGWIREKVSFDAAYGGERIVAYLFLPDNAPPPYQTVIYFPGSASTYTPSSENLEDYYEFPMFLSFLVRNGRAVLYPVYKGTFERGEPTLTPLHVGTDSYAYTELLIQIVKDFRRSIDYLAARSDIDSTKLAFYGMSWGGGLGTLIPAVEKRLAASILLAGGLNPRGRPEASAINYITRVKIPTLMLNGKYDSNIDDMIRPAYDLLGTPLEHKSMILYETDHIPPRTEYIKETLAWLDKYLGPVR